MKNIKLSGRVIIEGRIKALSGIRIGGSTTKFEIGGLDLPVIRNPVNNQPYIPGSSLKGKMRSLSEKLTGAPQNWEINGIYIHVAGNKDEYQKYWVNPIFGVPANPGFDLSAPTRLVVRDVPLDPKSLEAAKDNLEMPFTEIKWENALDRVTSAATPRQIERVPAGAIFTPMELVFNVYQADDLSLFEHVLTALQLVQDDYLGGHGSRGSGKVAFENMSLTCKIAPQYGEGEKMALGDLAKLTDSDKQSALNWVKGRFTGVSNNGAK